MSCFLSPIITACSLGGWSSFSNTAWMTSALSVREPSSSAPTTTWKQGSTCRVSKMVLANTSGLEVAKHTTACWDSRSSSAPIPG